MNRVRFCLAALAAVSSSAADWPRFRGPNGDGITSDSAPIAFGPASNLAWRTPLPDGLSSPVIANRRVWLTGADREHLITLALDASTGKTLWRRTVPRTRSEKLHKLNHPASPSCAVDRDRVVSFFPDFGLIAYTAAGRELWRVPMGPFTNLYGIGVSPIIAAGKVILVIDQAADSYIAAYHLHTGQLAWKTPRPEAISGHSTPILHHGPDGRLQILAPGSFRMDAYDAESGRPSWYAEGLPSEMKSVPVIDAGRIYIHGFNTPENDPGKLIDIPAFADADTDRDGRIAKSEAPRHAAAYFAIWDQNRDNSLDHAEWDQYRRTMSAENGLFVFALDHASPARLLWKFQRSIPQLPSPLVYRNVVYLINESGILTTLHAPSGRLHAQTRLRGVADTYYASPIAAAGRIYIASHTGTVTVLEAGPQPRLLAANHLEEEILATPAISAGAIFIRTRAALYCFR